MNSCLDKIRVFLAETGPGRVRQLTRPSGLPARELPREDGVQTSARADIVLKAETFVELGSPSGGGYSFLVWTTDPKRVEDGRIILVGPDIPELEGKSQPYCQVVLVGGSRLAERDHLRLQDSPHRAVERIPGYMARSGPGRLWVRVGKALALTGWDFTMLGTAVVDGVKRLVPGAEAVEVVFVTSSSEDVEKLAQVGVEVENLSRWVRKQKFAEDGDYACADDDCGTCDEKVVCDNVRDVLTLRGSRTS